MLPTTLTDHLAQVRHDVAECNRRRDTLIREHDKAIEKLDDELREKRAILDDYEAFFEWQHQRDGGHATVREMKRVLDSGERLSPDEHELARALEIVVPDAQHPTAGQVPIHA